MLDLEFRTTRFLGKDEQARFIDIYENSFPPEQRDDSEGLLRSIVSGKRICEVVYGAGELLGLAVLFRLSIRDIWFLEYFAVRSDYRGKGIGSQFLANLIERVRIQEPSTPGMVFEVEAPDGVIDDEQRSRERRIEFYERNGAALIDCAFGYEAPNLAGEGSVRYHLMWMPTGVEVKRLQGQLLRGCVKAILTESYGLEAEDRLVVEVLERLIC